ncbi:ankyrin repeat domain-containing protein [Roseivirga sp.]|uniref:ankyrin repeat domain-containing protein n=1 Tax=Roseivirga sp. TaxID=1964215 RepID=UPI002B27C17F|nr:ankyrin repeat domain-containing protein [Roseivirga sp.]
MKTKINQSLKVITAFVFIALTTLVSCGDKKLSTQESAKAESKVSAPKIDIHTAVVTDDMEALKQHIAAGSDINRKDPIGGSSPLITASLFGKTKMAIALIDAGANINFTNNEGSTALHTAAFFCRTEIVQLLLDKGADKTVKNNYGSTAYESVAGPFKDIKSTYQMMEQMLAPMGLKVDYDYLEKTRPVIAEMLK